MGSGGSVAVDTDPPAMIIPPGTAGAGGAPAKMACADDLTYRPSWSPGYSDADHAKYLAMAQTMRGQLNPTEKAEQLRGVFSGEGSSQWHDIQRSYDIDNAAGVRIKGWQYRDGPRGLNLDAPDGQGQNRNQPGTYKQDHGRSTAFPAPVARGAAFDVGLEYRIGMAMGDELVAANFSMLLVPCVNILRHPFWGRAQETYGEDTYHLGRIGTGLAAGVQEYGAACVKHWAANNIERNRPGINSDLDAQTLREVYGRHFEMIIQDGGVSCVMAAYNSVNGVKATQSKPLLTTILRDEFKFKGLVLSDWWAMPGFDNSSLGSDERRRNALEALDAGLDLEVPWSLNYRTIEDLVASGSISQSDVDVKVDRVLAQKVRFKAHVMDGRVGLKAPTTRYVMMPRPGSDVPEGHILDNDIPTKVLRHRYGRPRRRPAHRGAGPGRGHARPPRPGAGRVHESRAARARRAHPRRHHRRPGPDGARPGERGLAGARGRSRPTSATSTSCASTRSASRTGTTGASSGGSCAHPSRSSATARTVP